MADASDHWARAVESFTGYKMPSRHGLFKEATGLEPNGNAPLISVAIEEVEFKEMTEAEYQLSSGPDVDGHDFVIHFYMPGDEDPDEVTDLDDYSEDELKQKIYPKLRKVVIDFVGPDGADVKLDYLNPFSWNEGDDSSLAGMKHAMGAYVEGAGSALYQLGYRGITTHNNVDFSSNGVTVDVSQAMDFESFTRTAQAYDRVAKFFLNHAETLKQWKESLGEDTAAWKGKAAEVFADLIEGLHKNYRGFADQMHPSGFSAKHESMWDYYASSSVQGDAILGAGNAVFAAIRDLYDAWKDWESGTNVDWVPLSGGDDPIEFLPGLGSPYGILFSMLESAQTWAYNHNARFAVAATKTSTDSTYVQNQGTSGGSWITSTSETQFYVLRPEAELVIPGLGWIQDVSTWAGLGTKAVDSWNKGVEEHLEPAANTALSAVNNAFIEARRVIDEVLEPEVTSYFGGSGGSGGYGGGSGDDAAQKAIDEANERAQKAIDEANARAQAAVDKANEAAEKARAEAEAAIDKANSEAEKAADEANARADEAVDKANEAAEKAKSDAEKAAEEANNQAKSVIDEAKDQADKSSSVAKTAIDKANSEAEKAIHDAHNESKDQADKSSSGAKTAIDEANSEAEKAVKDAHNEANNAANKANSDAKTAIDEANEQANKAIDEANNQAKSVIDDARDQLQGGNSQAQSLIDEANNQLQGGNHQPGVPLGPTTSFTTSSRPGDRSRGDSREHTGGVSVQNPDGSETTTYSDGTKVTTGPDGTVTQTDPDGSVTVTKPDGSVTVTKPDGSVQSKGPDGEVITIPGGPTTISGPSGQIATKPDGSTIVDGPSGQVTAKPGGPATISGPSGQITTNSDGSTIVDGPSGRTSTSSDGTVTVTGPDGSTMVTSPDGSTTIKEPDGTVTEMSPDGSTRVTSPDGSVTVTSPDGSVQVTDPGGRITTTYPDGSVKVTGPDGSTTVTSPDGSTTVTAPNGSTTHTRPDGSTTIGDPNHSSSGSHRVPHVDIDTRYPNSGPGHVDVDTRHPNGGPGHVDVDVPNSSLGSHTTYPSMPGSPGESSGLGSGGGHSYGSGNEGGSDGYAYDDAAASHSGAGNGYNGDGSGNPFTQGDQSGAGSGALGAANSGAGGGSPMMPPMGGMRGGGESPSERERSSPGPRVSRASMRRGSASAHANRRAATTPDEEVEEDVITTRSGTPLVPAMPPSAQRGQATQSGDRERTAWVAEDEDVWGTDEGTTPAVIGR